MGSPAYFSQLYHGQIDFFSAALPVHPTQLYEMIAALIAAFVSGLLSARLKTTDNPFYSGLPALTMIALLSIGRLTAFYFRDFPNAEPLSNMIRGPVIIGGTALISVSCILGKLIKHRICGDEKRSDAI